MLLARGGAAQSAAAPTPAGPGGSYAVAAYLLGLLAIFLVVVIGFLLIWIQNLRGARHALEAPGPRVAAASAAGATAEETDAQRAVEEGKLAIQRLLRNLADCVSDLLERHTNYDNKMENHRVAIQKAMTLAGLEEIERLIIHEIEEMRISGQRYRVQLDHANAQIQEQNEALARVQADARLDHLTQLPNRRVLEGRLAEEYERSRRYGSPLSMIMLDIDHFKAVNDTHGHMAGDKVLQLVSLMLQNNIRKSDFAARYGGEEFAIVLPETAVRPARSVAEKIRKVIEESALRYERAMIHVTVSAGVGELAPQSEKQEEFIKRVDGALYKAKREGRNRVEE